MRRTGVIVGAAIACLLAAACDIEEVTVAPPEDLVIAEVYLRWENGHAEARALLHRSLGRDPQPIEDAVVRIRDEAGRDEELLLVGREHCLARAPNGRFPVGCYRLPMAGRDIVRPGEHLRVSIVLASGERLQGATTMPEEFSLVTPAEGEGACGLAPGTIMPLAWTRARGAWAYLPEASIEGLREAFAAQGIGVRTDPVVLVGLSVSEADTTITFPSEFGIFNRFSDEAEVLLALRDGLPPDTRARIVVSALDRNATNWSRGGGFNPSGWVRIPSMFGDGTGVLAATVVEGIDIEVDREGRLRPCIGEVED